MRVQRKIKPTDVATKQQEVDLDLIDPIIEKYKNIKGSLIPILQGTQEIFGYLPESSFYKISKETGLNLNELFGVATFYTQFRLNPAGKHIIKVCHGTACHVQNADSISDALEDFLKIKDGQTTDDNMFTIESVACLGCCSLAPVIMVGDRTYGKLDGKKAIKIIRDIKKQENTQVSN
ncbi:MAG: NADH-quinone oxidoreductase subunit NuoE [Bacteroidales bacterium]|jgi:NADH-quinone oxidoreductase subunit E|nr:NADH-quinone oxidoreductase subunit NuoE [Bacteroidales bacterium]